MAQRMHPEDRRAAILDCALRVAQRVGWRDVTREMIAKEAGVTAGLVSARIGHMPAVRQLLQREASRRGIELQAVVSEAARPRVFAAGTLSGGATQYRLEVTGPMGAGEIAQLIDVLRVATCPSPPIGGCALGRGAVA